MRKSVILLFSLLFSVAPLVKGQSDGSPSGPDIYTASAGETIFSWGDVDAGTDPVKNVVRFSPFFNIGQQVHFDFSNSVGFYTGLDLRNVGLITHTTNQGVEVKIKERSYGLGLPIVLKVGNFKKGMNLGVGGEAELMFAWKRKIFVGDDTKTKEHEWFSDNVNVFNPSLLAEVKFSGGGYIRFKYYLDDFLQYQEGGLTLPALPIPGNTLPDYAQSSTLMYISAGLVVSNKEMEDDLSGIKANSNHRNDGFFRSAKSKEVLASHASAK